MTWHDDISEELDHLQSINCQNTAFGRIASLLGSTNSNYDLTELAEDGVLNMHDKYSKFRHFSDAIELDRLNNSNGKS